ncbi:MAG TPA: tetratricopeptide repeat protein [Chitinophagaceae bacterium]|nr:tetratricopeptide repeat protein [Chitinophagaceae bacterium]
MKDNPYREDREQIDELLKEYENLQKGVSHSFFEEEAFEKIITHFQDKDDLTRAMEAVRLAVERYPYSGMLLIKKADIQLASRRYQEALDTLELAALLDNGDINLYILRTDAYLALDRQEKAVELLQEALNLFEGAERVELLFELADVYDDYEEFDKVFDCLKTILEQDPNNEEALYKICFWTDYTGRNEESIRLHRSIIDEFPYNELAWFNLGAAYQGLKLYEKAIDAYQYALVIDEKFDYAYRNIGDAYIRLKKYREAIEMLEKVIELAKPEDVVFEAIGHCYDRLKNFAQARFYYRKATHLRQDDDRLYYKIACSYFNETNWTQCTRYLEQAMKIRRNHAEYNLLLGECKVQSGDFSEAVLCFSNVVRLKPRNLNGWEALVRCLYKAELFEEALEKSEMALAVTNGKPLFSFYKAAALVALGKTKEASLQLESAMLNSPRLLKKAVELNPSMLQNQLVVDVIARFRTKKSL